MQVEIIDQVVEQVNDDASLQNIPEDCLLEIFSKKTLNAPDLCSIAEACKRFRAIVRRVVAPKKFCFTEDDWMCEVILGDYTTDKDRIVERIFRNFGACLRATSISFTQMVLRQDPLILYLLGKYCSVLKMLHIENVNISEAFARKLEPSFKGLETLHLRHVSIEGGLAMFRGLDSLVELEVDQVQNCILILQNVFPKLKRLTYRKCKVFLPDRMQNEHREVSSTTLQNFYTSLKTVDVDFLIADLSSWIQQIGSNCPELEKLTISNIHRYSSPSSSLQPLEHLKSLRYLELCSVSFENFDVFEHLTDLLELSLNFCSLPSDLNQIACLHQLTNLRLYKCSPFKMASTVDIVSRLVKLVELEIGDSHTPLNEHTQLNEHQFSAIERAVADRPQVLTLICNFNFNFNEKKNKKNQKVILVSLHDSEVF